VDDCESSRDCTKELSNGIVLGDSSTMCEAELDCTAHDWRNIAIALIDPRVGGFECNGLWVLKKSVFLKQPNFGG
jgi:hypothetical protein